MPNIRRRFEKLREKRRLAKERVQKIREDRKRAREVKEEKWTTKNEHILVADHRKVQRSSHLEGIRKECSELLKVVELDQYEKEVRKRALREEIIEEIEEMKEFMKETSDYYDEIHQQISPPEEKSVDQIVADIEKELKEVFDIFENCFEFEAKLPEISAEDEKDDEKAAERDKTFTKDIAHLESEIEKNMKKSENLVKEISIVKNSIEMENVRFAAVKKDKATDKMLKGKKIKRMEEKLKFVEEDPVERGEIITIGNRITTVTREKLEIEGMIEEMEKILKTK